MALPVSGKTYTFTCVGASPRVLNLYYLNSIANGQNVCLWTPDGSLEQQWKYSGGKLLSMRGTSFALDKYTVSGNANNNNADIWTANDPTNQNIIFEAVSGNTVMIKLSSSGLYLTAYNNANGSDTGKKTTSSGNVFWAVKKTDPTNNKPSNMQQWTFKEVDGGSVTPGSQVTVTGMPAGIYANNTEYFHSQSGMKNGTWAANNGAYIEQKVKAYYKKIYGVAPTSNNQCLYNLFGAKLTNRSTYHIGLDVYHGAGSTVKSAHSGEVIYTTSGSHHGIGIYDGNRTYYYLHMNNVKVKVGDRVTAGITILGEEGMAGDASGYHVHLEVFNGRQANGPQATPTINGIIPSISPYNYI